MLKRILITPGEPAGIGPDITIQLAQHDWPVELVAIACPELLHQRAAQLGLPLTLINANFSQPATAHTKGTLKIVPVKLASPCEAGKLNPANANYVVSCLEKAADLCLKKQAAAIVTGPVHKAVLNDANILFSGHTEFFAKQCNVDQVIMLFVTDKMKVALATTHLPLTDVPKNITQEKLIAILRLLHLELQNKFCISQPKILVCGLNPHAGENGHLGREEIDIIIPALMQLQKEHINVIGPLPADTLFTEKYLKTADAVLGMYHDQALPVVKFQGFGHAVNVTLGLPIIRTSVDHGTALDLAGTSKADASSLMAALKLAIELAPSAP